MMATALMRLTQQMRPPPACICHSCSQRSQIVPLGQVATATAPTCAPSCCVNLFPTSLLVLFCNTGCRQMSFGTQHLEGRWLMHRCWMTVLSGGRMVWHAGRCGGCEAGVYDRRLVRCVPCSAAGGRHAAPAQDSGCPAGMPPPTHLPTATHKATPPYRTKILFCFEGSSAACCRRRDQQPKRSGAYA